LRRDVDCFVGDEANLALALARQGKRTGILDTDIFGPSIPKLFNLNEKPRLNERKYTYHHRHVLFWRVVNKEEWGQTTNYCHYRIMG
jgi:hypothetical protein